MVMKKRPGVDEAPSMIPQAPPPKVQGEVLPDVRDVVMDRRLLRALPSLVEQYAAVSAAKKEIKEEKERISRQIKAALDNDCGLSKFMVGGYRLAYYTIARSTIKPDLLLSQGVAPAVIAACTVTTNSPTLKITPPGVDEDE
jgi:hypothetical protein